MKSLLHIGKEILSYIAVAMLLLILITNFIVMVYSLSYLVPYIGAEYFGIPIYFLVPVPVVFLILWGTAAYMWYMFLAGAITISLTLFLWFGLGDTAHKLMTEPTSYRPSSLQEFAELFSLTLFVSVAIVVIMHLVGVKTEGIGLGSAPLYAQMLSLLHASVYEEIVTRLVFLGLPVYLLRRFFPRDGAGRVSPLTILGGVHEIGKIEIVFIIISATIFGVAHTPAWGWWKLVPAFFAGLVMGYLYIKYGIHYSIMFHFATDYMYVSMSMNSLVNVSMGLVYLALIAMGVVFAISYTVRVMQRFHILKKKPKKKDATVEEFEPWIDVRCPTCGSQEFSYLEDGKLKCLRCGTIFEREYQEQPTQSEHEYPESTPPP